MCKHILNAQVSIRAACCKKWFDCPECHEEQTDHPLRKSDEMVMGCKKCRKVFRKNVAGEFDDSDEYCPHCDNKYVIEAVTPQLSIGVEGEDARVDARMLRDDRVKGNSAHQATEAQILAYQQQYAQQQRIQMISQLDDMDDFDD